MNEVFKKEPNFLSPELQRNLHLLLDKLTSKYRMIRDFWLHFDRLKLGRINLEQFANGLTQLMIFLPKSEIEALYKYMDKDSNGYIEYKEF